MFIYVSLMLILKNKLFGKGIAEIGDPRRPKEKEELKRVAHLSVAVTG
jgi:hypothetical protein